MFMNELFTQKYDNEEWVEDEYPWKQYRRKGYGFIYIKNPDFPLDDDREYLIRKPTPKERREIVVNTVMECNGRTFKIPMLAKRLGVSDRTIQTILRQLQNDGLIEIYPKFNKEGKQKGNAYKYIGPPCEFYGTGLTLKSLYDITQDVGFRDWAWKTQEFYHDQTWHNIYPLCRAKFEKRMARKEYLEQNNLPLVVPEDLKYLVLRYCYWKGNSVKLRRRSYLYSQDRTVKLALEPLNRIETVNFCGITLYAEIGGTKDNPQVTIIDADTNEQLTVFTWFDENILIGDCDIDEELVEQVFILGDFTTK